MNPALAPASAGPAWGRRKRFSGLGLVLAVPVQLLILAAVLRWHPPVPPPPPPPRDLDVTLVKPLEPPPQLPKPEPQLPELPLIQEPPPLPVIETPPPPEAAAPVVAPPVVAAPGPDVAPVAAAPASAAAPVKAASAVGSTRLVEDCADAPDRMMVAEVYRLSARATSVKEMDRRKPVGTVCLTQLDIAPRHMGLGLPGLDMSEWYGLDIRFTLNMPADSERDLVLVSDDGGVLYVDGVEVANNDGLHGAGAVMGSVKLTQGAHDVRVRYFQGPGDGALMLGWKKAGAPTSETKPIPRRLLGRPSARESQGEAAL